MANEQYKESLKGLNVDDKKGGKKDAKKEAKKEAKKDNKKGGQEVGLNIGGVWRVNPFYGSIPPESSINIEVCFVGNS